MNTNVYLTQDRREVQEAFWASLDLTVKSLVGGLLEEVLRLQQQAHLAAAWNQRTEHRLGYRNGSYRRSLGTPYGLLQVNVPRCRGGGLDCSMIFDRYQRRMADVDRILRHAYLLGISTRGTAKLGEQIFGGCLSHQTVSRLMRWLDEQLAAYRQQPICPVYPVVYVDGMHVDVVGGDRMVMLVAGRREDKQMEILGFSVGTGERCVELLGDLRRRGLEEVELFVSDDSGAIRFALEQAYPDVAWQHCTFHRLAALRANIGQAAYRDLMVAEAACIFRCPSRQAARDAAAAWAKRWKPVAAWAVQQFMDGLSDSLMFYNLPKDWWQKVRTNNPLESVIRRLRQRLRPMGCFHDHSAIDRAVLGQLARWHLLAELTHNT